MKTKIPGVMLTEATLEAQIKQMWRYNYLLVILRGQTETDKRS